MRNSLTEAEKRDMYNSIMKEISAIVKLKLNEDAYQKFNEEDMLDEGLKDWVKNAIVATGMAVSLFASPNTASADVIMTPKQETVIKTPGGKEFTAQDYAKKIVKSYADKGHDIDVFVDVSKTWSQSTAYSRAIRKLMVTILHLEGKTSGTVSLMDKLIDTKQFYNESAETYTTVFILTSGTLKEKPQQVSHPKDTVKTEPLKNNVTPNDTVEVTPELVVQNDTVTVPQPQLDVEPIVVKDTPKSTPTVKPAVKKKSGYQESKKNMDTYRRINRLARQGKL